MIGQYLSNNNENSYSAILQKKNTSKPALDVTAKVKLVDSEKVSDYPA
jgi:hypothetical protein